MSILNVNVDKFDEGIKKTIDKNSEGVALDILQRGIYAYPVKSTIRELASNAFDANIERETAKSILKGESKIEDHYDVELKDGAYHASGWDPDYYDIKYLSDDMNVYLMYDEGDKRDTLRIKDNGIGLGKDRLVGYFQLAYSSKRTQKGALGKWGLGNKSALSLGIESYTVINRYNGKKFKFEVFLNNVVSTTPKFGNNRTNDHIVVTVMQPAEDGGMKPVDFIFYYEDTTESNGLEVIVPVKKHEKKQFFRAIEEQLMYIPNVVFQVKGQGSYSYDTVDIAAKILYRDENIIISESTVFDFPHLLLGTGKGLINYGKVDFESLELEKKRGAVGLILNINDVEVTPPREAVVWSAKTRNAVIDTYNKIVETATKIINKELDSAFDYLEWIQKAASIKNALVTSAASTGTVLQKLSGIIDASAVNKIYYLHHGMKKMYVSDMGEMFGDKLLIRTFSYSKHDRKINREKMKSVNSMANATIYITSGASDKYRDRYLFEQVEQKPFIVIKLLENWSVEKISNLVGKSSYAKVYDDIIVPEDIIDMYLAEEAGGNTFDDEESTSVSIDPNRLAKLRKLEQKILFHVPYNYYASTDITYSKKEIKISEIVSNYINDLVVYGSFDDRDLINSVVRNFTANTFSIIDLGRLSYSYRGTGPDNKVVPMYGKLLHDKNIDKVSAMLVSKENEKYIKSMHNFIHIRDFIIDSYKDGLLVFNKNIRLAMTLHTVADILNKYSIPDPESLINEDEYRKFYGESFSNILVFRAFSSTSISRTIDPFFKIAIVYELNKDTADDIALNDYLQTIDSLLPEALCDKVDEITDVHIVDVDLIKQVEAYCSKISRYVPILREVAHSSDLPILGILKPLIEKYEGYPEEINYF